MDFTLGNTYNCRSVLKDHTYLDQLIAEQTWHSRILLLDLEVTALGWAQYPGYNSMGHTDL